MCDVNVRFTNGSATRSTLADARYIFHVHGSFATGIVLWANRTSPCTANGIRHCSFSSPVACTNQLRRRRRHSHRRAQSVSPVRSYPDVSLKIIAASEAPQADHKLA
jgi:hypothetical protein